MQTMNAKMQYKLNAGDLDTILALVRTGTLAEAGIRLGVDGSTVFRSIQRIERGLSQRLFERSRAGYLASEFAKQLANHGERIEAELETARSSAQQAPEQVSGIVRITSTDTIMNSLVVPTIKSIHLAHPQLQFELHTGNELVNLTRREADIAIRATLKPPQHLVGKQLGVIRVALFAEKNSLLNSLEDAINSNTPWIAPDEALPGHPSVKWRKKHFPKINPIYSVSSILTVMESVIAGLGVGVIPLFMAAQRQDLKQISEPLEECNTQLWILTHAESRHLRRVSTVFRGFLDAVELK
jgi:DNA-binding transcriptional LysR family regulator